MRENHAWFVIRGIPLAILDPPSLLSSSSSSPLVPTVSPPPPSLLAQRPRAFLLVYGIFFTRTAESYIREG